MEQDFQPSRRLNGSITDSGSALSYTPTCGSTVPQAKDLDSSEQFPLCYFLFDTKKEESKRKEEPQWASLWALILFYIVSSMALLTCPRPNCPSLLPLKTN
jgi:hypothetical protein